MQTLGNSNPTKPSLESFYSRCLLHSTEQPSKNAISSINFSIKYSDLVELIDLGSAFLFEQGIDYKSKVGILIDDEVDHFLVSITLLTIGATQLSLASHYPSPIHDDLIRRTKISHLITNKNILFGGALKQLSHTLWAREELYRHKLNINYKKHYRPGKIILMTSGTTGKPNLMSFTENEVRLQAERHVEYKSEGLLRLASFEHNNSRRHRLYCTWQGGVNIFFDKAKKNLRDFIIEREVSCLDISRLHATSLINESGIGYMPDLKVRTGGSSIPLALRKALRSQITPNFFVRYASSESGGIAMAGIDGEDEEGVAGHLLPGVNLEIVNEKFEVLSRGESGIIRIRAPGMAMGYLDNIHQTNERFSNGWFYPGDLGYLRLDGQLVVQGRRDEMIIMNGLNIFPSEIEVALEEHPAVHQAAALALTSRIHGQIPVAAVELHDNAYVRSEELLRWAQSRLGIKSPRRVVVLDALPRNSQGKITKNEISKNF